MIRSSFRWRTLPIAILATALAVTGCGSSDNNGGSKAPEDTRQITEADPLAPQPLAEETELIVTLPIKLEAFSQVLVADYFGEFEKENLNVKIETMPGNEAVTLLSTGGADVQLGGPSAALFNAIDQGLDLTWAASNYIPAADSKQGLWLSNDLLDADGEPDPEKIKGMTISIGSLGKDGTVFTYVISDWLKEIGLTLDDIDDVQLGGPDQLIAMENGSIDGAFMLDPYWQEMVKEGSGFTFMFGQKDSNGGFILGPSRHDKPEALEAFFRAVLRTNQLYLEGDYHADQNVLGALAEIIEVPAEDIAQTPSLDFIKDLAIDPDVAERIQQLWLNRGVVEYDEPMPLDAFVDQSIVLAILDED